MTQDEINAGLMHLMATGALADIAKDIGRAMAEHQDESLRARLAVLEEALKGIVAHWLNHNPLDGGDAVFMGRQADAALSKPASSWLADHDARVIAEYEKHLRAHGQRYHTTGEANIEKQKEGA